MSKRIALLAAVTVALVAVSISPALADDDDDTPTLGLGDREWRFDLVPMVWLTGINGQISLGEQRDLSPFDLGEIFGKLDVGGDLLFQARSKAWTILVDLHFARLSDSATTDFGHADLSINQFVGELSLTYRVPKTALEFLVGGRINHLAPEAVVTVDPDPAVTLNSPQTWFDPIIGARFLINEEPVFLSLRADIGGFGVGSSLTWSFAISLGYQVSDLISVILGFRFMDWDYSADGTESDFIWKAQIYGPTLGIGFHF